MIRRQLLVLVSTVSLLVLVTPTTHAGSTPARAKLGMVVSQSDIASEAGFQIIKKKHGVRPYI